MGLPAEIGAGTHRHQGAVIGVQFRTDHRHLVARAQQHRLGGEVLAVNEDLRADPSLANTDPMGSGWFFKIKLSNPAELDGLMDETSYTAFSANA